MEWIQRLRGQPLRVKLIITAVGTGVIVFGVGSTLTFGYWRAESVAAAEQQALLAAASVRASVESALTAGQPDRARQALLELVELESVTGARLYGTRHRVLISTDRSEEGQRPAGVWIPSATDLPNRGTARPARDGEEINAFLPVRAGRAAILEVDFSLAPLEAAMDRAARLGLLLLIGSLLGSLLIVALMLEREVVAPIERVARTLVPGIGRGGADELERIEASVADLLRKEHEAIQRVAEHERRLADQAGFVQVGEMAAEMAHEFKRPLASIRSAVSLLEQEYQLNDEAQSLLGAVDDQLGRLTETMRDLFALARPVELDAEQVDLADVVNSACAQLSGLVDLRGRRVERDFDPATPHVLGDPHRLEQAVLNLMLNAVEAMDGPSAASGAVREAGDSPGGRLTLSLRPSDAGAVLEVRDTGAGIPEGDVQKILLPFYSTRPAGTGLGLPLVARVVAAHGGRLEIESEVGRGTTVRVVLPERTSATHAAAAAGQSEGEPWRASAS